jgi:glycine dehydrogenase subunit 1
VVREFALRLDAPVDRVVARCREQCVNPGYPLGRDYPEYEDGLLVAITEQRTRADIDRLAEVLGAAVAAERHGRTQEVPA